MRETFNETFADALKRKAQQDMAAIPPSGEHSRERIGLVDRPATRANMRDENGSGRDVSGLRFSVNDVAKLAGVLMMLAAAWWALNNRTDGNYLALNAKLDAIQVQMTSDAKLRDQRDDTYVADQRQLKANVELLKIDVQDLKLSMAKAGLYKGGS